VELIDAHRFFLFFSGAVGGQFDGRGQTRAAA
jgi:hypothetical protein